MDKIIAKLLEGFKQKNPSQWLLLVGVLTALKVGLESLIAGGIISPDLAWVEWAIWALASIVGSSTMKYNSDFQKLKSKDGEAEMMMTNNKDSQLAYLKRKNDALISIIEED